jgi:hypothetical protein
MQDEISRMPAEEDEQAEKGVLGLLLASVSQQPWSVVEVERELGKSLAIADAITSLHAAGLIHRCGEFVLRVVLRFVWTASPSEWLAWLHRTSWGLSLRSLTGIA